MRWTVAVVIVLLFGGMFDAALAAPSEPLTLRDFTIDLYQGPVLGGTRVVGLGGAYVAIAEGFRSSFVWRGR